MKQPDNKGAGKVFTSTLDKWSSYISEAFMWLGGIILIGICLLTVIDVFGRSALRTPVQGTIEMVEMMLVCVTFSGIVYTTVKNGHVKVELLLNYFPKRAKRFLAPAMILIGAVAFALLSWQLGLSAFESMSDGLHTSSLAIPLAPFKFLAAICSALTCLLFLKDFIFYFRR